jgi:hypothetical protein
VTGCEFRRALLFLIEKRKRGCPSGPTPGSCITDRYCHNDCYHVSGPNQSSIIPSFPRPQLPWERHMRHHGGRTTPTLRHGAPSTGGLWGQATLHAHSEEPETGRGGTSCLGLVVASHVPGPTTTLRLVRHGKGSRGVSPVLPARPARPSRCDGSFAAAELIEPTAVGVWLISAWTAGLEEEESSMSDGRTKERTRKRVSLSPNRLLPGRNAFRICAMSILLLRVKVTFITSIISTSLLLSPLLTDRYSRQRFFSSLSMNT